MLVYWNSILEYNTEKYWKTTGVDGTAWADGNKPKGKLVLNLESVIAEL